MHVKKATILQETSSNPGCHPDTAEGNEKDGDGSGRRLPHLFRRVMTRGAVIVCVLMLLCLPVSIWVRGRSQEARVATVLKFEGSVEAQYGEYSYEPLPTMSLIFEGEKIVFALGGRSRVPGYFVADDPPGFLEWLVPLFGDQCFARVTRIHIDDPRFSDADVDMLLAFPDVRVIDLSHTQITDRGLIKLATLDRLVIVDVEGTQVSADSLRHLAACRELKELDIRDTNADEEVLTFLKEALPHCWILWP